MERILLVDDEKDICSLLSTFLSMEGYEVITTATAEEGLELLENEDFALLITDYKLAGTTGIELIRKLQQIKPSIASILITGYSDVSVAVQAIKAGAMDCITKPIYPDTLLTVVRQLMERRIQATVIPGERPLSEAQAASQPNLEAIVRELHESIVSLDPQGLVNYWNPASEELYGYAAQEIIGKPLLDYLVPKSKWEELRRVTDLIYREGKAVKDMLTQRKHKSGKLIDVLISVFPLKDQDGRIIGTYGLSKTLNALKKEEKEALKRKDELVQRTTDRYEQLYNAINEGFCIIEVLYNEQGEAFDFRYLDVNAAFEKQTGIKVEIGKTVRDYVPDVDPAYVDKYAKADRTGEPVHFTYFAGSLGKWFEMHAARIGKPEEHQVTVLFSDITGKRLAEDRLREAQEHHRIHLEEEVAARTAELKESRKLLDSVLENTSSSMMVLKPIRNETGSIIDLEYVFTNNQLLVSVGRSTLIGLRFLQEWPGKISDWLFKHYVHVIESGQDWSSELHYNENDFDVWSQVYARKLDGNCLVTYFDITQIKKAELQIKEQAQLIKGMTETMPDMVSIMEYPSLKIRYTNHLSFSLQGFDAEHIKAMSVGERRQYIHPDDHLAREHYYNSFKELQNNDIAVFQYRAKGIDGRWQWFYVRGKVFERNEAGQVISIVNVIQNISAQKAAEQEIVKNLTLLQQAEDLAEMGSWNYNVATAKFHWSEGMFRIFHLSPDSNIVPETYLKYAIEEDKPIAIRVVTKLKLGKTAFEEIIRIQNNGPVKTLRVRGTPVYDEQGNPLRVLGVDIDISGQVKIERELLESLHFSQRVADTSPDIIFVMNLDTFKLTYSNKTTASVLGYMPGAIAGMENPVLDVIYPEDKARVRESIHHMKSLIDGDVQEIEYRVTDSEGNIRWFRDRNAIFRRDAQGVPIEKIGFSHEVTRRKRAEEALIEAERLVLIGKMTRAVAHEVRNPLSSITMAVSFLQAEAEKQHNEAMTNYAETAARNARRIDQLISNMLYIQKQEGKTGRFSIRELLNEALTLQADRLAFARVKVEKNYQSACHLLLDRENMTIALLTLISNAIEAMEAGKGVLRIGTEEQGGKCIVTIRDNGHGIRPEDMDKIFEPFFSRKTYGMGLGLTNVKSMVEANHGRISAESTEGQGTVFRLVFPVAE